MLQPRFRHSLLALALVGLVPSAGYASAGTGSLGDDAHSALSSSIALIRRVLGMHQQQDEIVSHAIAVSRRDATLEIELAGGRTRTIALRDGQVLVDDAIVGTYVPGGALERSWRRELADGAELDTRALMVSLRSWRGPALTGDEATAKAHLDEAIASLGSHVAAEAAAAAGSAEAHARGTAAQVRLADLAALDSLGRQLQALDEAGAGVAEVVRSAAVRLGNATVAAGQRVDGDLVVYKGDADVYGEVTGSVVALYGDVAFHRGAVIGRNVVSIGGAVHDDGGTVRGDIKTIARADLDDAAGVHALAAEHAAPSTLDLVFRDVRNVLAVFVAFAMLGFGTVFFGRRYVEVIADTATHSFGRAFVVGLLGQLLLLPTFAMLVVGLVFTIVGILLLPFAAAAFVIAAILAAVGGYLAVAHAIGETFTRRRMAHGAFVRAPNAYGYLFTGLVGLLGLWAAAALTGWMGPVVIVFRVAAVIVTWIAATTGFGAVLLSRAGLRETFAGRHIGEMSDEYLWATPPATPTAARMSQKP